MRPANPGPSRYNQVRAGLGGDSPDAFSREARDARSCVQAFDTHKRARRLEFGENFPSFPAELVLLQSHRYANADPLARSPRKRPTNSNRPIPDPLANAGSSPPADRDSGAWRMMGA